MKNIFVNLKRFDVPVRLGGICPAENSQDWIEEIIRETAKKGLGQKLGVNITYFIPESLLIFAVQALNALSEIERAGISIGSQGVYRDDVRPGGNFGAFTTNLPAAVVAGAGATWSIVGHSEERKDKFDLFSFYDSAVSIEEKAMAQANSALNTLLNMEAERSFEQGLNVCFCIGETAEERGEGEFTEQQPRIKKVLKQQLEEGLSGLSRYIESGLSLILAYEPRWAIGPGKTPPGPEYISFVSSFIKETVAGMGLPTTDVLYGGGLKRENAAAIAGVPSIDGGLVALTKFTQPVAFDVAEFKAIIEMYLSGLKL